MAHELQLFQRIRKHTIDGFLSIPQGKSSTLLDFWSGSGDLVDFNIPDGKITAVSSDDADTLLGAGAQRLVIRGNDTSERFEEEDLDLAGQTPVETLKTFQGASMLQAKVISSDDLFETTHPTGDITLTQGGSVVGVIRAGEISTFHCFRRIPFANDGTIERWDIIGGYVTLRDLGVKADASIGISLWHQAGDEQIHTDGTAAMQASGVVQAQFLFRESYESGDVWALRVSSDQDEVEFAVTVLVEVLEPVTDANYQIRNPIRQIVTA